MDELKLFSFIGLLAYFVILLLIVVKEKRNDNVEDFFFAGRQLPFWALSVTFIASWWGAGSALSTADLAFEEGIAAYWYYGVPVLISSFLLILLSKVIRSSSELTQGGMMRKRYNLVVARALSVMIAISMTISASSQMVGIGDFFGTYLGLQYEHAVYMGTLIVLIYSVFGGFRGVVVTDVIQFVLLLLSALIVFFVAYTEAGGWDAIAERAATKGNESYLNFFDGLTKYGAYVLTFGFGWSIQANVWQRIVATRNTSDARKMATMSFLAYIPLYLIVILTGMAGYVLYDQLPQGGIVAALVNDYMPPVMGAFTFVGISAAIMSTMDSLINTGAMSLTLDMGLFNDDPKKQLRFSQVSTLLVTAVALFISLRIRSILTISWIASDIIITGILVPLLAGFFWKRGTSKGALVSMFAGASFCFYNLAILLGVDLPHFWQMESSTQVLIGITLSSCLYFVVSLLTLPDTGYKE